MLYQLSYDHHEGATVCHACRQFHTLGLCHGFGGGGHVIGRRRPCDSEAWPWIGDDEIRRLLGC